MLTHRVRDRTRGDRLALQQVVKWLSHDNSRAVGLDARGLLAPGFKADINVFDPTGLHLRAPEVVRDLPTGGRRLVQSAAGYRATIVAGQVVYADGQPTGALPGWLVRGAQPSALVDAAGRH